MAFMDQFSQPQPTQFKAKMSMLRQMMQGDPAPVIDNLARTNPQFAQFLQQNQGRTPQEAYMKDLAASQAAQNAYIAQGFANEVDALYNRLNTCPVPTTPVYGRTPIFTCNQGQYAGCPCAA